MRTWESDQLDVEYLADSGLLFKINQTVTHLFGIGVGIRVDAATGAKTLAFIDARDRPQDLVFNESSFEAGEGKYQRFRAEFGANQIMQRQEKLGCATQNYPWTRRE